MIKRLNDQYNRPYCLHGKKINKSFFLSKKIVEYNENYTFINDNVTLHYINSDQDYLVILSIDESIKRLSIFGINRMITKKDLIKLALKLDPVKFNNLFNTDLDQLREYALNVARSIIK